MKPINPKRLVPIPPPDEAPNTPKRRSMEQLRATLSTLCHFIWNRETRPGEHLWSIPVDHERDFDCILSDAIDELEILRLAASGAPPPRQEGEYEEYLLFQLREIRAQQIEDFDRASRAEAVVTAMRETLEWIAGQSDLFFAECSQAEEIIARCKRALAGAPSLQENTK